MPNKPRVIRGLTTDISWKLYRAKMISLFTPLQAVEMSPGWEGPTPSTPLTTPPGGGDS